VLCAVCCVLWHVCCALSLCCPVGPSLPALADDDGDDDVDDNDDDGDDD
jgi:hypothetical protein